MASYIGSSPITNVERFAYGDEKGSLRKTAELVPAIEVKTYA